MKKILFVLAGILFAATGASAEEATKGIRAQFTSGIENREPVDELILAEKDDSKITFFSEIKDRTGETITHVWKNGENEIFQKSFDVKGQRWRVWSSMSIEHFENGDKVTVEVKDSANEILFTKTIDVVEE